MSDAVSEDEKTVVNFSANPQAVAPSTEMERITFNKPAPGGRRIPTPAGNIVAGTPESPKVSPWQASPLTQSYENPQNPLLAIAQPLLNQVSYLNQAVEEKNISAYRTQLTGELQQFEFNCGQCELSDEETVYARYVLCTALDELVNKTPWRSKGEWAQNSLLAQYHGETGGGEKFFDLLNHLLVHPAKHLYILELMFVIMNLGFEGKYHLEPKGYLQLEQIKDNLFQVLRLQRGEPEPSLSIHWQGISDKRNPLMRYIPAWVFVAVTALLLVSMYSGFKYLADEAGSKTLNKIQQMETDFPKDNLDNNGLRATL